MDETRAVATEKLTTTGSTRGFDPTDLTALKEHAARVNGDTGSYLLDVATAARLARIAERRCVDPNEALRVAVEVLSIVEAAEEVGWQPYLSDGREMRKLERF